MFRFIPKTVPESKWRKIDQHNPIAIRATPEDTIFLKIGAGKGIYFSLIATQFEGRLLNAIEFDSGEDLLLYKISLYKPVIIGRTSDTPIKLTHPYVSRHHVELELHSGVLVVQDLGSVNGTFYFEDNASFDIEKYLATHSLEKSADATMDFVHELFGPDIDDFLKSYLKKKETKK